MPFIQGIEMTEITILMVGDGSGKPMLVLTAVEERAEEFPEDLT